MSVWRYTAIPLRASGPADRSTGELTGESATEIRASLRRIGLQAIDVRPMRRRRDDTTASVWRPLSDWWALRLRKRRAMQRAELYDRLATMVNSGVPLLEAVDTVAGRAGRRRSPPAHSMLVEVRERLRGGASLAEAMREHHGWFDPAEIAMVDAAQHAGELPAVLRTLADRHERSSSLGQKLVGALTYPAVVAVMGLAVVIFLSVKTLPDLTQILTDAGVEIPALSQAVMDIGQFLAHRGWLVVIVIVGGVALFQLAAARLTQRGTPLPARWRPRAPLVLRRVAVAAVVTQLAELLRAGVPIVEALRVLAPTTAQPLLRRHLARAADAVERGDDLAAALHDPLWFDDEFQRLVEIGQASGELDTLLDRVGQRYERQSRRLIDRAAALLEPTVILALAVLVGVTVMAAVLPLVRLREIF